MRRELVVPKLGLTMEEGTLIEWLVKPGERFRIDQGLFVIESEKAAVEVPAESDGSFIEGVPPSSTALPVGAVIGYWEDGEEGQASAPLPSTADVGHSASVAVPAPQTPSLPSGVQHHSGQERIPVTPLARRLAQQRGIDLAHVQGSGPRGRIRARDLPQDLAVSAGPAVATPSSRKLRKPTAAEQTIARRLTQSKRDIPHFYLAVEADVGRLLELRKELNDAQQERRYTLNHFLLAAVSRALTDLPEVNSVWTEEGILTLDGSDVGMAVQTERGLVAPVLRNLSGGALAAVVDAAGKAITQAQAGRLPPDAMAGGAITVSNAGMYDVTSMISIINPGQSMILGVGSVREVFRPDSGGRPELRRELGMVLSADHRVLDGVRALRFLKQVVSYLEQPLKLVLR